MQDKAPPTKAILREGLLIQISWVTVRARIITVTATRKKHARFKKNLLPYETLCAKNRCVKNGRLPNGNLW